jgi:phage protein U
MRNALLLPLIACLAVACGDGPGPIDIDDTGAVTGTAYVDRDGDGRFTGADDVVAGVAAALLLEATGDTMARATSRADGSFIMSRIPAGRYRLVAQRGAAGDSIDVLQVDSAQITIAARDTVTRHIRLGYPRTTAAAARLLPAGRRITVEGIALNARGTYGDETMHLADATGAIRAIRVAPNAAQAGDSISLVGTTGSQNGFFVLADATVRVIAAARGLPPLETVTTAMAATADNGRLADGQLRIAGAFILDTITVANDRILGVSDGSGRLEVMLDKDIPFNPGPYIPGGTFDGAGLLVPTGTGNSWRLKPRDRDEAVLSFATATIAQARTFEDGRRVVLEGIALNGWSVFGDSTVHLYDATGWLRAVRVTGATSLAAGDSVRLLGTMGTRNGQRTLTGTTASIILRDVGVPAVDSISTARAASAHSGALDAAQARIAGTIIGAVPVTGGGQVLTVNDGTGALSVVFHRTLNYTAGPLTPGALINVVGLLVPTGTGSWQLKPRTTADINATHPTVTVQEARALPTGRTVYIFGIALNGWATFGDQSVHLRDGTGSIRILNLPTASIFAGDSIRILGTVSVNSGQPVLTGTASAVLLSGVGTGAPDSVTTAAAANAGGGARDADQLAVSGTVSAVSTDGGDFLLTISDGSGDVVVRLDADVGFLEGTYKVGDVIRARGVLVPNATGTAWQLKPRALNEVAVVAPA